jgi:hypothetical protein
VKFAKSIVATLATVFATLPFVGSAVAQGSTFVDLGVVDGYRISVTGGSLSMRIGNGVLMRYFSWKQGDAFASSERFIASCRGQWLSSAFDGDFHDGVAGWTPTTWNSQAKSRETQIHPFAVSLDSWAQSDLGFAPALRPKVDGICRSASAEPRNFFVPVSASVADKNDMVRISAIVTGTAVRKDHIVDVWLRSTEFKLDPMMLDGKPLIVGGKEQKVRTATGNYSMSRAAYDCKNRTMGTYQIVTYLKDGSNSTDSVPREKLRFSDVTPNSVGEAELDAVCMLYGPPPQ